MGASTIERGDARDGGLRRGRRLEYLTVGWNLLEGMEGAKNSLG
jgi:hypothetical protein